MKYFIKVGGATTAVYVNPDHVKCMVKTTDDAGKFYWAVHLIGHAADDPLKLYVDDAGIAALVDAVRQEQIMYSVPIEAVLGPKPTTPF